MFVLSLAAYARFGVGWKIFFVFFLVPDIAFAGYLAGPRFGAIAYNLMHSSIGAVICLLGGLWLSSAAASTAGMIWFAHIGFDRALGYGLKYLQGFGFTHLGLIGRKN